MEGKPGHTLCSEENFNAGMMISSCQLPVSSQIASSGALPQTCIFALRVLNSVDSERNVKKKHTHTKRTNKKVCRLVFDHFPPFPYKIRKEVVNVPFFLALISWKSWFAHFYDHFPTQMCNAYWFSVISEHFIDVLSKFYFLQRDLFVSNTLSSRLIGDKGFIQPHQYYYISRA